MGEFIKVGGSSGSGGSPTFDGLSDKASVDLPGINTPLANALSGKASTTDVANHTSNIANPHSVTKTQVGLSNVDNTSDASKPISTATQTALDTKEATSNKRTNVDANKTSDTFFPTVKAVFDWVSGLFVKGAASSTDNAIARFDGVTGKLVQNSNVTINDNGNVNLAGQLEFNTTGGLIYFGNFSSPNNNKVGFSVPGTVVLAIDSNTKMLGVGGAGAYFASNEPNALLHVLSRSVDDTTLLVQAIAGQTADLISVYSNLGNQAFSVSASGGVRVHANLLDNTGSAGTDGQVLKKVGGQVVWSNP